MIRRFALIFAIVIGLLARAEDDVRLTMLGDYEKGVEAISSATYAEGRRGRIDKTRDLYRYTLATYRRAVDWHRQSCGVEGASLAKRVEKTLSGDLEKLFKEMEEKKKASGGRYSSTLNMKVRISAYDKAIKILLLDENGLKRWLSVESLEGNLAGRNIHFEGGEARITLPFRIFQRRPYIKEYEWVAMFSPDDVFTVGAADYVIVRFAYEDNLEGMPATTEERAILKIEKGKIVGVVPLHNLLKGATPPVIVKNTMTIEGVDGLSRKVKYVINLSSMRMKRNDSVVSPDFMLEYADVVPME